MKLTTRSEYALLALIYLARNQSDKYISVEKIATAQSIPRKYLEQILLALKMAHFISSAKGKNGGYRLSKSADEISIADIIRLFDGALAPTESASKYFYEITPIEKEKTLLRVFKDIRDHAADKLETTKLSDVL